MKRRRKKTKYRAYARKIALAVVMISVVMLFLWPYLRSAALNTFVSVGRGRAGTLEERVTGEALFADWSSLVVAPTNGTLRILVQANESVRAGQAIAEIGSPNTAEAMEESLAFARGNLRNYEESTAEEFQRLSQEANDAYAAAVDALFSAKRAFAAGSQKEAVSAESRVKEHGATIAGIKARISEIEDRRAELAENVLLVENAVASTGVQVLSPIAGILSWEYSSYDRTIADLALTDKDASQLMAIIREDNDARVMVSSDGQSVKIGDAVGRVVSGRNAAFYFPVKTEERPDVKAGQRIEVRFGDGTSAYATITGVKDACPPGYSVLTGEVPLLDVSNPSNSMEISLVTSRATGIIVPTKAILNKDGQTGVLTVEKTYARFSPVEVVMTKGKEAVVRGIAETDEIVLGGMGFLEGRRVR